MMRTRKIGVVAGSFDPVTNGHMWLFNAAEALVDKLYIVVGHNPAKKYMFTAEERVDQVQHVISDMKCGGVGVCVVTNHDELLINFANDLEADFLFRGIRNSKDYEYEQEMRHINEHICDQVDTVFLIPPVKLMQVSSSTIKGLTGCKGWKQHVDTFVHPYILDALEQKAAI